MVSCAADGLARRPAPTSEDSTSLFSPRSKPEAHYKKSLPCHPTDGPASDEFLRACSHSANHRPRIARETKQPRRSRTSLSQVAHAHHQHTRGKTPRGRERKRKRREKGGRGMKCRADMRPPPPLSSHHKLFAPPSHPGKVSP